MNAEATEGVEAVGIGRVGVVDEVVLGLGLHLGRKYRDQRVWHHAKLSGVS